MDPTTSTLYAKREPGSLTRDSLGEAQLFALHEVMQAVARQTDMRETLALVAEKARSLTGADSSAVTLLDATRTMLDFTAAAGSDAEDILGQTVRVADALAGQTALTGEIYLAHHPAHTRPLLATLDPTLSRGWGVRSAVVVPIYLNGRSAGALAAINRADDDSFGGGDVLRLQLLANAAALALSADGLQRLAGQKQRERDILFQAARTTSSSLNVQEVLSSVLATVSETLEMAAGAVFLPNDERTRLYVGADRGLEDDDRDRQLQTDGTGPAARALASPQPLRIADTLTEADPEELPLPGMRSLLLAPMIARSLPEGLLVVGSRQTDAYTKEDADLLSAVASQAAVALENAWLYEDATRRAQEATAIYEMSQTVGATLQLDRMLHFVADSVLGLLHVDKFALFLHDPRTRTLEIKIARNFRRETVESMKPRPGEGIAGWVFEFETPTAVQDVAADHRNRSCPIDIEGAISLVSVPLQSGDDVIGVLHAMSSRRRLFTVGEMELLYTIANQVGAAIANAQRYEEARQQSDEIRKGVRRVARALGSSLSPQETAQVVADLATETTGADRSILYALDDQGLLRPRAASNFKAALATGTELSLSDDTATAWVARRGRSLHIEDWAAETRLSLPPFAQRDRSSSYLGVPMKMGKDVLGVLEVHTRAPRRFTPDEVRLLLTFASQASVALQNALLVEQAGQRLDDLKTLGRVSELLSSGAATDEIVPQTLALLLDATQSTGGLVTLRGGRSWSSPTGTDRSDLQTEAARFFEEATDPSSDAPLLLAPLPGVAPDSAAGVLILARAAGRPPFGSYDQGLAKTIARLLSIHVR
jgi:GAF domain-containing protein